MSNQLPGCPVCGHMMAARVATGRKSGKPFVMLTCPADARHFRGFIGDRTYVREVLAKFNIPGQ
jgi:hypothetical protein